MDAVKTRVIALGDSITCGEGVGVRVHLAHTWGAVLAHALGADFELLAQRGARTAQLRSEQLPIALARRAPLATVLVGLNDVSRTGWQPTEVPADLRATVTALRNGGSTVLLARLHDPTTQLPMPARIRAKARERIEVINAEVDALTGPGVPLLDLARVPELWTRSGWAVDRVHPSVLGHRAIAQAALGVLRSHGWSAPQDVSVPSSWQQPGRLAEAAWLALHGAPFLLRNVARPLPLR
jgi:lysophospholipase L1-like esterase